MLNRYITADRPRRLMSIASPDSAALQNKSSRFESVFWTVVDVRLEQDTVWLSQVQIADLFGTKRPAITKHLSNIFKNSELDKDSVCSILEHTAVDGKRYKTQYYNLDAIISVGHRVNSVNATQFRTWANQVLKDCLIKHTWLVRYFHSPDSCANAASQLCISECPLRFFKIYGVIKHTPYNSSRAILNAEASPVMRTLCVF